MRLLSYLLSELRHSKKFVAFFIFNLCIGLSGFIALDGFKSSIDLTMKERSKSVLGADLSLSSRRPLEDAEGGLVLSKLPDGSEVASVVELYSMVRFPNESSRLVKIKAVSKNYPFYGGLQTDEDLEISSNLSKMFRSNAGLWVFSELMVQGDIEKGSSLKVGEADFAVDQVIIDDSTSGMGASFAPTIYMSLESLKKTELLTKGSLAWHSRLYKIPDSFQIPIDDFKKSIFKELPNADARLTTHSEASEQMGRLLQRLNDFLGLAAIVALFLAAVGTGFLYRSYFQRKTKEVAILISLGLTKTQAASYYLAQIVFLGFISAVVALGISYLLVPIIHSLTAYFLPFEFEYVLTLNTFIISSVVGIVGSLFICLPFLSQLKGISPVFLLADSRNLKLGSSIQYILLCLPGLFLFWGLSVWQANSVLTASAFVAAFLVAGAVLVGIGYFVLWILKSISIPPRYLALHWALRDMSRERLSSISCFLALGLGAALLNLVPQVQASLEHELSSPENSRLPSLFLFDIQEDQLSEVKSVFQELEVNLTQVSPMIRSRLIAVNNEDFDKGKGSGQGLSREEESEMRFRNRGFNLSYREGLSVSESIYSGTPIVDRFEEGNGRVPQISMEKRFADRLQLKIGDLLRFDIEGVPLEGTIVNLRTVKWTSFQPNFFIQFQPGSLDMAPKTFIATSEGISEDKKVLLQKNLVQVVPNVSIIDVSRLIAKVSEIIRQMSLALQTMALLCLISGFVVIFSILSHQMEKKRWQIGLKKVLGAPYQSIRGHVYAQYLILSLSSAVMGVGVSILFSYVLSRLLFESVWVFSLQIPAISILVIALVTVLVIFLASRKYLSQSAKSLIS